MLLDKLDGENITDDGVKAIADAAKNMISLSSLYLGIHDSFLVDAIEGFKISDDGAKAMADTLKSSTHISTFSLCMF